MPFSFVTFLLCLILLLQPSFGQQQWHALYRVQQQQFLALALPVQLNYWWQNCQRLNPERSYWQVAESGNSLTFTLKQGSVTGAIAVQNAIRQRYSGLLVQRQGSTLALVISKPAQCS
ncbi:hypothetical protein CWI84_05460 [Idiomarina tyrosinivorans]|uniref:DUF2509 family protein n=1 Tax=Idiomarina tyrosinivorans TaxID=1445662 RepID=A0A432ZRF5_9GAMM|nr:hypothetical protein [Idiomarina tyrosinivorans]RUO80505.1 hypothetical protein CWI84_05460 [Idiomarina tyrosinivorans]